MNDSLFIIDWQQVKPETYDLLKSGNAKVINGVARNVSEKYQIIQHMPFKQVNLPENSSNLMEVAKVIQSTQTAVSSVVAISSAVTIGAIVVSTAYLAKKLDKIQNAIDTLQQETHDQNLLYYSDKISQYFGSVEAMREIINHDEVVLENNDLIVLKISEISNLRNQLISFLDSLISLSDNFTFEHKSMAIDFINMTFNLIPKGIFIENQAAYKIERFYLGDKIQESARIKYNNSIQNYRDWANNKIRAVMKGNTDTNTKVLQKKLDDIKSLISSEENKLLLECSA